MVSAGYVGHCQLVTADVGYGDTYPLRRGIDLLWPRPADYVVL